jgi:hypothetical protein
VSHGQGHGVIWRSVCPILAIPYITPQLREEFLIIPQADNAETDETGFGDFVTMPLGIFVEYIWRNF